EGVDLRVSPQFAVRTADDGLVAPAPVVRRRDQAGDQGALQLVGKGGAPGGRLIRGGVGGGCDVVGEAAGKGFGKDDEGTRLRRRVTDHPPHALAIGIVVVPGQVRLYAINPHSGKHDTNAAPCQTPPAAGDGAYRPVSAIWTACTIARALFMHSSY